MKKFLIAAFLCLFAWPVSAQSTAEQTVLGTLTTSYPYWNPITSSNQLPIAVYDLGNHSGYCYTSNGSASAATFQVCGGGGGGGGGSSTIGLSATTTDATGTIAPGVYTGSGGNASPWFAGYSFAGGVSSGTVNLGVTGNLPIVLPTGSLYLRMQCLTSQSLTSGTVKYTVSDAVISNSGDPSSATLMAETQTSLGATTTDTLITTDTPLSATASADHFFVGNIVVNATGTPSITCRPALVIK